jgi:hypothetical protein
MKRLNTIPIAMLFFFSIVALVALSSFICCGADLPRSSPEAQGIASSAVLSFVEAADKNVNW